MKTSLRQTVTRALIDLGIFSVVLNLLLLFSPIYMMQIYDRVLPSGSIATLAYLSLFAIGALVFTAGLDFVRSFYCQRVAVAFDRELGEICLTAAVASENATSGDVQHLRDLSLVRGFIASRGLANMLDLPFIPFFAVLLFLVHPLLCLLTVAGAGILVVLVAANRYMTRGTAVKAQAAQAEANLFAQALASNGEIVQTMGTRPNVTAAWGERFAEASLLQEHATLATAAFSSASRTFRTALQLAILGTGAILVIRGEMTAGMIFASSIISGRTLQPIDQLVGNWQQLFDARRSWDRISAAAAAQATRSKTFVLPAPRGRITVSDLLWLPPKRDAATAPVIKRISLEIGAGEAVAVLGPSGAGKSTFLRILAAALTPSAGRVSLDGSDYQNWNSDQLGAAIGYLPQDVQLLPGSVAQNIARFDPSASDEAIVEAARLAEAHEMIIGLQNGYKTSLASGSGTLSGGTRQRVGLARAFFGNPKVLVLDEPNSNLDMEGELALNAALQNAKRDGRTVIIVTHRPSIVARCDRAVILSAGAMVGTGPAVEMLHRLSLGSQGRSPFTTVAATGPTGPGKLPDITSGNG